MDQQPPVGRDSMEFRKEQKVEINNLEHKEMMLLQRSEALSRETRLLKLVKRKFLVNLWYAKLTFSRLLESD